MWNHFERDRSADSVPRVGQMLKHRDDSEITKRRSVGDEPWILEEAQAAIVVDVDKSHGVKLRNFRGATSEWLNPKHFYNEFNGKKMCRPDEAPVVPSLGVDHLGVLGDTAVVEMTGRASEKTASRVVTAAHDEEHTAEHKEKNRPLVVGDLVVSKSHKTEFTLKGTDGTEFELETSDTLLVIKVGNAYEGNQFKVRTPSGGVSKWLSVDDFQFSTGGDILVEKETGPEEKPSSSKRELDASLSGRGGFTGKSSHAHHEDALKESRAEDHHMTERGAQLGERVVLTAHGKIDDPEWDLGGTENAIVVAVNDQGYFKLRNPDGYVSNFLDPEAFRFALGGRCKREKVPSTTHQNAYFPEQAEKQKESRRLTTAVHYEDFHTEVKSQEEKRKERSARLFTRDNRVARVGDTVIMPEKDISKGLRRQDGATIFTDESSEMLVVAVCPRTSNLKLRTSSGEITDYLGPNSFLFVETSTVCLKPGQKAHEVHTKPTECPYWKPAPPRPKKVRVDPDLYVPATVGSPLHPADEVSSWQQKLSAEREPIVGPTGWESEEEQKDAVGEWQQRHQGRPVEKGTTPAGWGHEEDERAGEKSRDLDFSSPPERKEFTSVPVLGLSPPPVAPRAEVAAEANEQTFVVTRKDGKLGIISSKTTTIKVSPGSAAADAGLVNGMVVKSVNGTSVKDSAELMAALRAGGQDISLVVAFGATPKATPRNKPKTSARKASAKKPADAASPKSPSPQASSALKASSQPRSTPRQPTPGSPPKIVSKPGASKPAGKKATGKPSAKKSVKSERR